MDSRKPIVSLPATTVRLISSTQIITSVKSIVKELLENALDAGATAVKVKLDDSGMTRLEVSDNGHGVAPSDVHVMCLPHFTSKIGCEEDLHSLKTYGFRGEALNALCSVAKVSITTATEDSGRGIRYILNQSGEVVDSSPSHLGKGTTVTVSQLFNNVPVRKHYYRTIQARKHELTKVEGLLTAFGLIQPDLHISLHHNKCLIWQKARAADLKTNIRQVLGHSMFSHMELKEVQDEQTRVQVTVAVPKATAPRETCFRQRPDRCFIFINKRPVTYKGIEKILKEVYQDVPTEEATSLAYPLSVIAIEAPPDQIDVNLEPNKTTVLLQREEDILDVIRCAVKDAIQIPPGSGTNSVVQLPLPSTVSPAKNAMHAEKISDDEGRNEAHPQVDSRLQDPVRTDDDFHGFDQLWNLQETVAQNQTDSMEKDHKETPKPGTMEWSKGVARDADGHAVHPAELLRSTPLLKKRMLDIDMELRSPPRKQPYTAPSKLASGPPSQVKMVNSTFIAEPAAAYDEYCNEMRPQLRAQNPSLQLADIMRLLDEGWRNLDDGTRSKYEQLAARNKKNHDEKCRQAKSSHSEVIAPRLDRFLLPRTETPLMSTAGDKHSVDKPFVLTINCAVDQLGAEQDQLEPVDDPATTWKCVGSLKDTPCWVCVNREQIALVNVCRLYEVILYGRLLKSHPVPSRVLDAPIHLSPRSFENETLWRRLIKLSKKYFENSSEAEIVDWRLTCNGFTVRLLSPDAAGIFQRAMVTRVPAVLDSAGTAAIGEILSECGDQSSDIYRPPEIVEYLKAESVRLTRQRLIDFSQPEVEELLKSWSATSHANECLHGSPIAEFL